MWGSSAHRPSAAAGHPCDTVAMSGRSSPRYEVISTSRGRVVTGPVSPEHERLRRLRVRRALIAAIVAAAVFMGVGAWGLVQATHNPQSPYNQPKHQQHQDPFGF